MKIADPLLKTLREEIKLHEQMLLAKRKERTLIVQGDAQALIPLTQHLTDLAEQVRLLEADRAQIVHDWLAEQGKNPTEAPTLKEIVAQLPKNEAVPLAEAGGQLRNLAMRIRDINRGNATLLERSIQTLSQKIHSVLGSQSAPVYTSQGKQEDKNVPRAGLNVRA